MDEVYLREDPESVRQKLTHTEYVALIQADRDRITPLVYRQGLMDGAAKALEQQKADRMQRREREAKRRGEQIIDYVYFIRSDEAVKIGTSRDPQRRLAVIQTAHPGKLEIAAQCRGDAILEREYHRRFAEHRLAGEWFAPHPDIIAEITRLSPNEASRHG